MATTPSLTRELAERALAVRYADLPEDVRRIAVHCVLDWFAVTLAGMGEPAVTILAQDAGQEGGPQSAAIAGRTERGGVYAAALVNGTAAHALDYDDVNLAITGHPCAVVLSAVLALAESLHANGEQVIAAFVSGYEIACHAGRFLGDAHYERGYHATSTAGVIGAAAACAHLLELDPERTCIAIGLAATQAGGLKALFGTSAKPLHAGLAARNGVMAARLAAKGFDAPMNVLEAPQGYGDVISPAADVQAGLSVPVQGAYIYSRLFKYHAACYGTNAAIDCAREFRHAHPDSIAQITRIQVRAHLSSEKMCNVAQPTNPMQAKFSLRLNIAFGLLGFDTADLDVYSPDRLGDPAAVRLRDMIEVAFVDDLAMMESELTIHTRDGSAYTMRRDAGQPLQSLDAEELRLHAKFRSLCTPVLGPERTQALMQSVIGIGTLTDLSTITQALMGAGPDKT